MKNRIFLILIAVALALSVGLIGCGGESAPEVTEYSLAISSTEGGSLASPGEGTSVYDEGEEVNLVAVAEEGYQFVEWTGDVDTIANINEATTTITMNSDCVIVASFEEEGVTFADPNLEAVIREETNKPTGGIYRSDLEGITSLNATERNITCLIGLEFCYNLAYLYLRYNQIEDISPLASLTSLTELDLGYNQISSISPLANLHDLTVLDLDTNYISDISPLINLTDLTHLNLGYSHYLLRDISPLANLTNLTRLNLWGNRIDDISPLANLTSLTELDVGLNQLGDISPLTNLTSLTELNLGSNPGISDFSPLANLTSLTYLRLLQTWITDLSPLANLTSLRYLDLWCNGISDISPLANLTSLTYLYLGRNGVSNIYPLVHNEGLSEGDKVDLSENPLSADSINIYIPQLEAKGVIVSY